MESQRGISDFIDGPNGVNFGLGHDEHLQGDQR